MSMFHLFASLANCNNIFRPMSQIQLNLRIFKTNLLVIIAKVAVAFLNKNLRKCPFLLKLCGNSISLTLRTAHIRLALACAGLS